jgi:hypothetical protein
MARYGAFASGIRHSFVEFATHQPFRLQPRDAELVMIVEMIIVVEGYAVFCWIKNRKSMHSFLLNFELSSRYAVALRRTIALAA